MNRLTIIKLVKMCKLFFADVRFVFLINAHKIIIYNQQLHFNQLANTELRTKQHLHNVNGILISLNDTYYCPLTCILDPATHFILFTYLLCSLLMTNGNIHVNQVQFRLNTYFPKENS